MQNTIFILEGNSQKLDGGAMFGNAPKEVWQKWLPPDAQNRVYLKCRCLLLQTQGRLILFETGIGAFFPPQLKERFGVCEPEHKLIQSLEKIGFSPSDITDVVLSHLHFDHAGGLLTSYQENRSPQLIFTKAQFFVGKKAFERAKSPHRRDKASFIDFLPTLLLQSQRLHLLDFSDQQKQLKSSLLPQHIEFRQSDGHTPGLMLPLIRGEKKALLFASDLIPGIPWVHLPITMGYDRFPEKLIDEKEEILRECHRDQIHLFFTHDPNYAMCLVASDSPSRFTPSQLEVGRKEGEEI